MKLKKQSPIVALMALLALGSACQRENQAGDRPVVAGQTPTSCCPNNLGDSTITGVITSNIFLQRCKTYKLNGLVYVSNNATITIDEGTRIEGIKGVGGNPGGGLIITKGAKIKAVGSASCPIVFTSDQTSPASGDWSGVVILGKATTNVPTTTRVEGIPGTPPADATFGGTDDTDSSGVMQFVRIEYAGFELSANNEINGLTLAGVGSRTKLDHIEVFKSRDDSFEFFGGTVNASFLISVDALDDMFDFDNGYRGTITRALGLSDTTRADISESNGIESDNLASGDCSTTPKTKPVINHMTIVGLANQARASITNGAPSGTGKYGRSAHLRRSSRFDIQNSVFMGFNLGFVLDQNLGCTVCEYVSGFSVLNNNLVHAFVTPFSITPNPVTTPCNYTTALFNTQASVDNSGYATANPNANIGLVNPFSRSNSNNAANYFPASVGDARTFAAGAFDFGGADWTSGWSRF